MQVESDDIDVSMHYTLTLAFAPRRECQKYQSLITLDLIPFSSLVMSLPMLLYYTCDLNGNASGWRWLELKHNVDKDPGAAEFTNFPTIFTADLSTNSPKGGQRSRGRKGWCWAVGKKSQFLSWVSTALDSRERSALILQANARPLQVHGTLKVLRDDSVMGWFSRIGLSSTVSAKYGRVFLFRARICPHARAYAWFNPISC